MSEFTELSFKDISYIRAAIEGYIGLLKMEINSEEIDDDTRIDTQEDLIYYEKLLYMFSKAEKQSSELKSIPSMGLKQRIKE